MQGEEMISPSPDNLSAFAGPHEECHRQSCSRGLSPPGDGGARHYLYPLCLHTSGFSVKECICYSTCFNYVKDFDCEDHNKLWKILKEMGRPDHLTCLLRNLYAGQEATVRTGHGTMG